jgi:hypothetical protein
VRLSTLGPLARAAADPRAALRATGGPEGTERRAYAWSLPAARHARLADYRVRVVLDDPSAAPTSEVAEVMARAVDAITASGATLVEGWPKGLDPGGRTRRRAYAWSLPAARQARSKIRSGSSSARAGSAPPAVTSSVGPTGSPTSRSQ